LVKHRRLRGMKEFETPLLPLRGLSVYVCIFKYEYILSAMTYGLETWFTIIFHPKTTAGTNGLTAQDISFLSLAKIACLL
jgi:hypothetical protein